MKSRGGQSLTEYVVLVSAVIAAVIVMIGYVRRSFNAHANALESQLNRAVDDNRP